MRFAWALTLVAGTADPSGGLREALALEATEPDLALAQVDSVVRAHPSAPLPRIEAARLRLKAGRELDRAEGDLEVARALVPENPRAQFLFGLVMAEEGKRRQACQALELAVLYRQDYDEARFRLAGLYFDASDWARAESHYRAVSASRPERTAARLQLALVIDKQGRAADAEAVLVRLHAEEPDSPLVSRRLADWYEKTGRAREAEKLRRSIGETPKPAMRPLRRSAR